MTDFYRFQHERKAIYVFHCYFSSDFPHRSSILKAFLYSLQQRQPRIEFFRATRTLYEIWCSAEKSKFFTVIQFNIEGNCVSPTLWETLMHTCGNVSQFYGKCNIRNKLFPTEKNSILHMNVSSIVRTILNNATFIYIDFNKRFFIAAIKDLNSFVLKLYYDGRFSYLNEKFKIISIIHFFFTKDIQLQFREISINYLSRGI